MVSRKRIPSSPKEKLKVLAVVDQDLKQKRIGIAKDQKLPASTVKSK